MLLAIEGITSLDRRDEIRSPEPGCLVDGKIDWQHHGLD